MEKRVQKYQKSYEERYQSLHTVVSILASHINQIQKEMKESKASKIVLQKALLDK